MEHERLILVLHQIGGEQELVLEQPPGKPQPGINRNLVILLGRQSAGRVGRQILFIRPAIFPSDVPDNQRQAQIADGELVLLLATQEFVDIQRSAKIKGDSVGVSLGKRELTRKNL